MLWKKLGLVYGGRGEREWQRSHAYIPTAHLLDTERIRVFVAFLDREKIGRIGFVDVEARDPLKILDVSENPALDIGEPESFDESGVSPSCVFADNGELYMYYFGWQRRSDVRYALLGGLAVSVDDGVRFRRVMETPILAPNDKEQFIRSAPYVLPDQECWKMWYVAGSGWIRLEGKEVPTYTLSYLESKDKKQWAGHGASCFEFTSSDEYGFGRPFVIKEASLFRMWYSIRTASKGYRLGYGESADGKSWVRKDAEVGLDVSETGWDSEMVCFPCVQETKYGTYLFYNGNGYGETGFGVAVLEA